MRHKFRHKLRQSSSGNVLLAILLSVIAITTLVIFFVFNYDRLADIKHESKTAVDAAVLQAAKDIGKICINSPFGLVGLTDINNEDNAQSTKTNSSSRVIGLNTLLATIRLDALIAFRLGNQTMLILAEEDLSKLEESKIKLRSSIQSSCEGRNLAYDRFGNGIDVAANSIDSYRNFKIKAGLPADIPSKFNIRLMKVSGMPATPYLAPQPLGADPELANGKNLYTKEDKAGKPYYLANKPIPISGLKNQTITFIATSNAISSISPKDIEELKDNEAPSAILLNVEETTDTENNQKGKTISLSAAARLGGNVLPLDTSSLMVAFPQGFPNTTAEQSDLDFSSIANIMNASTLVQNTDTYESQYSGWNRYCLGHWFKQINGSISDTGALSPTSYRNLESRYQDDPSVAMSGLVYYWLRSLGPNISCESAVETLRFNIKDQNFRTDSIIINAHHQSPIPEAIAFEKDYYINTTILDVSAEGIDDPRNLAHWSTNPQGFQDFLNRVWSFSTHSENIPTESPIILLDGQGNLCTVDKHPVSDLYDLIDDLNHMNIVASQTFDNAYEVLDLKTKESQKHLPESTYDEVRKTILKDNPRILSALVNSAYCSQISHTIRQNIRTLSDSGLEKVDRGIYKLGNSYFYPATKAASPKDILSKLPVDTGQNKRCAIRDWCIPIQGKLENAGSNLVFLETLASANSKSSLKPTTASRQNAIIFSIHPANIFDKYGQYVMTIHRDHEARPVNSQDGTGNYHYQDVSALITPTATGQKVFWQVQAQDLLSADYKPSDNSRVTTVLPKLNNTAKCDFTNNSTCPKYGAKWAIFSPIVQAPPDKALSLSTPNKAIPTVYRNLERLSCRSQMRLNQIDHWLIIYVPNCFPPPRP